MPMSSVKNGFSEVQTCSRCIVDATVPAHRFDESGICGYCRLHDDLEQQHPLGREGADKVERTISRIKAAGRHKKYDCVIGISGGRDSTWLLYLAKRVYGLRPLAVHFNDGFGNPVAGENMTRATRALGVELRTITSDWRESRDLRVALLRASTPDLGGSTDIGIATALYSVAVQEGLRYILIGQSFRTEGIAPLEWNFLDGRYLDDIHHRFGSVRLRPWKPTDGGFNLRTRHMFYYTIVKGIRTIPILYDLRYVRTEAEEVISRELGWVNPGAHYYDDLYQSLMTHVLRVKFNIDRRKFNYSALVRSGQMSRTEALDRVSRVYEIEDPAVISLCIKRLGLSDQEFKAVMELPPKTFRDYRTSYSLIKLFRFPIWLLSYLDLLPSTTYAKYFLCVEKD